MSSISKVPQLAALIIKRTRVGRLLRAFVAFGFVIAGRSAAAMPAKLQPLPQCDVGKSRQLREQRLHRAAQVRGFLHSAVHPSLQRKKTATPWPKLAPMPAFVALLRAVNLGPHNKVSMAELKALAEGCGFGGCKTLLQSGNLVFEAKGKASPALEKLLEAALMKKLGLKTPVVVRSAAEWRAALDENPFPKEAKSDPSHLLVMPLKAKCEKAALAELGRAIVGREQAKMSGQQLYLVYPDGIGESKLTAALIEKKLGVAGTARNWNTAQKIMAALEA
jgi:uncharacterized protein (DUF1697 family)